METNPQQANKGMLKCVLPQKKGFMFMNVAGKKTQQQLLYTKLLQNVLSKVIILNGPNGNVLAKCYTMLIFVSFDLFLSCTCIFLHWTIQPISTDTQKWDLFENKVTYGIFFLVHLNRS